MAIIRRGKRLSAREQKAQTMAWTGWSPEQYQREYDRLRNRARNYERSTGAARINVADVLAREARRKYYAARGADVKQSALYSAIMSAPSSSTGRPLSNAAKHRIDAARGEQARVEFRGVIEKSKYKDRIAEEVAARVAAGTPEGEALYAAARSAADDLEAERKNAALVNMGIDDPFSRIFFQST